MDEPTATKELTFDEFRRRAGDPALTAYEKIGFPPSYRDGKEDVIFADIVRKLPKLSAKRQTVLDIGPGCSGPAFMIIDWCEKHEHTLLLVDSDEMLSQLPERPFIRKFGGRFPDQTDSKIDEFIGKVDVALCYSVLHYIFNETNLFTFLDRSLTLLADGGEMLIGDIPNVSKRKRFFSSIAGRAFHRQFTKTDSDPAVVFNQPEHGKIDDAVIVGLLLRARVAGCDAYLFPQPAELPMANRREDLFLHKP